MAWLHTSEKPVTDWESMERQIRRFERMGFQIVGLVTPQSMTLLKIRAIRGLKEERRRLRSLLQALKAQP